MSMTNILDQSKKVKIDVEFNKTYKHNINTIHNKVTLQMLEDSANHNDGPLRLLETVIFNPKTKPVEVDVKDFTVLKIIYGH